MGGQKVLVLFSSAFFLLGVSVFSVTPLWAASEPSPLPVEYVRHHLGELRDALVVAEDRVGDLNRELEKARIVLAALAPLEQSGAVPGKDVLRAHYEVQKHELLLLENAACLAVIQRDIDVWTFHLQYSHGDAKANAPLAEAYRLLCESKSAQFTAMSHTAEADYLFHRNRYETLQKLVAGGSSAAAQARDAKYEMLDAESRMELARKRAGCALQVFDAKTHPSSEG